MMRSLAMLGATLLLSVGAAACGGGGGSGTPGPGPDAAPASGGSLSGMLDGTALTSASPTAMIASGELVISAADSAGHTVKLAAIGMNSMVPATVYTIGPGGQSEIIYMDATGMWAASGEGGDGVINLTAITDSGQAAHGEVTGKFSAMLVPVMPTVGADRMLTAGAFDIKY